MSRQPTVTTVQHYELTDADWLVMEQTGIVEAPELRTRVLNFTNSHIYVRLNHLGPIKVAPMGNRADRCGVYILFHYSDYDNRPMHARTDPPVNSSTAEFTSSNIPYAVDANRRRYRIGAFFHESDIMQGRILHDARTDVYVGLHSCNWTAVENHRSKRLSDDDLPPPGFQFTVEHVTDSNQPVYFVTMADIVPIKPIPPELTGNQPGIYITSTDPVTGKQSVKFYTSCELCRAETKMAIFDYRHEAAEYLQTLQPSGKKGSVSSNKMEEDILRRAGMLHSEAANKGKAQQQQRQQQNKPNEDPKNQKGLMSVMSQLLESITKVAVAFKTMMTAFT